MNLKLINLMSMNFKLINLMSMNLKLINLMSMNFRLINLMSMNFKLINLMPMNFKLINLKLVVFLYFFGLFSALYSFCAFLYLWNLIIKKDKKFKTDLITSFILLLCRHKYVMLLSPDRSTFFRSKNNMKFHFSSRK